MYTDARTCRRARTQVAARRACAAANAPWRPPNLPLAPSPPDTAQHSLPRDACVRHSSAQPTRGAVTPV